MLLELQTGAPQGHLDLLPLIPFSAMTLAALSFGWIVGSLAPTPLAVPIAILATAQWVMYPLSDGDNVSWRNITGYATFMCCDLVDLTLDPRAAWGPVPIALALFAVAVLTIKARMMRIALPALVTITLAVILSNVIVLGTDATASQLRSADSQVCQGEAPVVCLYPEVPEATRDLISTTLTSGFSELEASGLDHPTVVAAPSSGTTTTSGETTTVRFPMSTTRDAVLSSVAGAMYEQMTCAPASPPQPGALPENVVVPYALALAMGADPVAALPSVAFSEGEGTSLDTSVDPAELRQALGIASQDDATSTVKTWQQRQLACQE
ncbi:hypothetical protein ACFY9N_03940 [Microbacterium sp. NPDC008134]|uniref:hypothetical protein n=1 Tax=Microbacterium sp. NPDC008134 TaxID=3364183 RepID=UPI0036E05B00